MAEERLSKLQKWIITNCFKVNVLLDRTGLEDLMNYDCWGFDKFECPKNIVKERNSNNLIDNYCTKRMQDCSAFQFYKEDILLSYFKLEKNNNKSAECKTQHFKYTALNNKAYVTLYRSLENLQNKNLIFTWKIWKESSLLIELSEKGREIALQLLNLDESVIVEPELISEEECQKKRDELYRRIKILENSRL